MGRGHLDDARRDSSGFSEKGRIAPGSDADIVLYDPTATQTFSAATHHMNVDYSAYEGMAITGQAATVLSRGEVIIENHDYVGRRVGAVPSAGAERIPAMSQHPREESHGLRLVAQTNAPARDVVELAKRAEDAGFTHFWTFDSCVLWQEPFVIYSQILANTSRSPSGRWSPTPSPATGRSRRRSLPRSTRCSAAHDLRDRPRRLGSARHGRQTRLAGDAQECMGVIKDLVEGREVTLNDRTVTFPWVEGGSLTCGWPPTVRRRSRSPAPRPTGSSCSWPTLSSCTGRSSRRWQHASTRAADERLRVCVAAPAYVGDDLAHQRDQVRWFGGMVGNHVADIVERYGSDVPFVPPALTEYIKGRKGYDYRHHGKAGNPDTEFVPDEVIDRFCVLGDVEQHRDKLSELSELGVDQFSLYLMHDDPEGTIDAYAKTSSAVSN